MSALETDVIGHLIDIEQQAATLLFEAQGESDRRITEAKTKADDQYKAGYEKIVASLEDSFNSKKQELLDTHQKQMDEFKIRIESQPKTADQFNQLLKDLLEK